MAEYKLLLPAMGESGDEATVTLWLKNEGDIIEADDAIVEIATDKVDSEVPSEISGKLLKTTARTSCNTRTLAPTNLRVA